MMMGGMGYGMVFGSLLGVLLLLGFAYLIWVFAGKEAGNLKTIGQVIAIVIAVLAVVILFYGTIYGGMMGKGSWCPGEQSWRYQKGMGPNMMMQQQGEMNKLMEKYHKDIK